MCPYHKFVYTKQLKARNDNVIRFSIHILNFYFDVKYPDDCLFFFSEKKSKSSKSLRAQRNNFELEEVKRLHT